MNKEGKYLTSSGDFFHFRWARIFWNETDLKSTLEHYNKDKMREDGPFKSEPFWLIKRPVYSNPL